MTTKPPTKSIETPTPQKEVVSEVEQLLNQDWKKAHIWLQDDPSDDLCVCGLPFILPLHIQKIPSTQPTPLPSKTTPTETGDIMETETRGLKDRLAVPADATVAAPMGQVKTITNRYRGPSSLPPTETVSDCRCCKKPLVPRDIAMKVCGRCECPTSPTVEKWEKTIMSLSKMEGSDSVNPVMKFPWKCGGNSGKEHKCLEGYVCHCDDGYLCEHRAKWLVKYVKSILIKSKESKESVRKLVMSLWQIAYEHGQKGILEKDVRVDAILDRIDKAIALSVQEAKAEMVDKIEKIMDKKRAKEIGDNIEIAFGDRSCKVCGYNPEHQREYILASLKQEEEA